MKTKYHKYEDDQLAVLLLDGDRLAYEEVYNRYFGIIYAFTRKMLRNDDQAEDMTQEIFLSLYEKLDSLKISSIKSYLYQSARYALIDFSRRSKTRASYMEGLKEFVERGEWSTDEAVIENELRRQIEKEIENLPPKMRAVFEMSRKQYLSTKEISEHTGLSEGTVRLQIHHAITRLRSKLTAFFFLQVMTAVLWLNRIF
ncbi:RNA polymerase sigma factor [Pedobacter sp. JY14-1]|uniref:RNA polymerase sigma factor n=1 Tax=Pedobacter sp. JY14-1 TaxID=3034151 RepID=UPI0023E284F3|nr:RNA polymerase sigma factor [Pedobacter sp. JY14-1]